jgi:hypothetical protein
MKLFSALLLCTLTATTAADSKKATAADCEPVVKKIWPVMVEMAKAANHPLKDTERAAMVTECKSSVAKDPTDPTMLCVIAAAGTPAVKACLADATKAYVNSSKKTEAALQLNKLGKDAKVYFITNAAFPKGKAKQLPEKACCAQAGHKCAVTSIWQKDPTWSALDFQIDEPNLFQYTYESDGKTFKATAVGDVSCGGHPETYTLNGKVVDGNPVLELVEPKH